MEKMCHQRTPWPGSQPFGWTRAEAWRLRTGFTYPSLTEPICIVFTLF